MADIIAGRKAMSKFFYQYGFGEKLSSVPQKRLTEIICGLAMKGNQSRTTDFAELKQGFRTSYGHAEYGGTKIGDTFYQDSRIDNLEPAGVFCKDDARYLVYILDFSAHVAPGTELFFAGGMSMDDDGWMDPGPGHILALSLENDGSIQLSFGHQGDISPMIMVRIKSFSNKVSA